MKLFLVFVSFILSHHVYAQAKELNVLLNKYAIRDFQWVNQPPLALQDSRELVVPHLIYSDSLLVMNWKDIDSSKILGFKNGSVRLVLYGNVLKFIKCKSTDSCNIKYFDSTYVAGADADSVFIPLILKTHGKVPALTKRIRKRLRRVLLRLNNTPVTEQYNTVQPGQTITYNRRAFEIVICFDCNYHKSQGKLYAKNLRHAKKISLQGLVYQEHLLAIESFDVYISKSGTGAMVSNSGQNFNDELLKLLKTIEPGSSVIFDNLKVRGKDGTIRTIQSPAFIAK